MSNYSTKGHLASTKDVSTSSDSFLPKAVLTTAPLSPPVTREPPSVSQRLHIGELPCKDLNLKQLANDTKEMRRGHVLEKINFNHLRLLTFYQLAITNIPQSHPAVLTSCVEQGGSEESPVEMKNVCDYRFLKKS